MTKCGRARDYFRKLAGSFSAARRAAQRLRYCSQGFSPVMEIVIDGLTFDAIHKAMHVGIHAIARGGSREGVTHITAGNYGGNLGPHHFHLKEIVG